MRSAVARQHGLDEDLVGELTHYRTSSMLTDAQKAAIELADALMSQPAQAGPELRERLHRHFTRRQIVELTVDVMKWNYQKVPVALGTDPEVVPGELSELRFDRDGHWMRPG